MNIQVQVIGDKEMIESLGKLQEQFEDWSKEFNQVSDKLLKFYQGPVFETEGGIIGENWQKLSQPYEFYKRKKFAGRGILQASGKMRRNFSAESGKDFAKIENKTKYAVYHQEGTRKMPARKMLKIDEERKNLVLKIFESGLVHRMKQI